MKLQWLQEIRVIKKIADQILEYKRWSGVNRRSG